MQTIIDSPRQREIEPHKPRFKFYFADKPEIAIYEKRGRIAHMLKSYRAHPELYILRRIGLHHFTVQTRNSSAIGVIST